MEAILAWAALIGMVAWIIYGFSRGLRRGLRGETWGGQNGVAPPDRRRPAHPAPSGEPDALAIADEIVQAYAAVLQRAGGGLSPETDLPAPKQAVKDALLLVAKYWHERGEMTPERLSQFKASYGLLADFVPGGDRGLAAAIADARRALETPGTPHDVVREAAARASSAIEASDVATAATDMGSLFAEWDRRWAEVHRGVR